MCGPTGSMFFMGLSIFGVLFLGFLATLIKHDYQYVGEWFETKGEPGVPVQPLGVQREAAVKNLMSAVMIYGVIAVASGAMVAVHKVRGAL